MNKRVFSALRKVAFESRDPELRDLLYRADKKFGASLGSPLSMATKIGLINGPAGMLGGWLAAALTPTWDKEDLEEYLENKDDKKNWDPLVLPYRNMKLIGALLKARRDGVLPTKKDLKKRDA